MTRLCVPIFVSDRAQTQRAIFTAVEAGADVIELRADVLPDESLLGQLQVPVPWIVTVRPNWEGGHSELADDARVRRLSDGIRFGASYADVELETIKALEGVPVVGADVIVSSHDFKGRPERLLNMILEMDAVRAQVNKLAWKARTVRDNLEAFELLQTRQRPTIALCMGEAGLISRVLAKKFGAFLTFAALTDAEATAPGQVTIADMKRLYRWDAMGSATRVFGVVGSPVSHSMSPAIHNAAFEQAGFDGVYVPLLVNEGYESFKAFMETFVPFKGLDLSGLSVTIPHKENALRYLTEKGAEVDPLARSIGAVNTIVIDRTAEEPRLRGTNTDYGAILDSITSALGISRDDLAGRRVAVLGAGGTGRTAVAALAHYGATVVIYNRTRSKADALAEEFTGRTGKVVAAAMEKLCDSCCEIYINTTSIGMTPNVQESPFGAKPPQLSADSLVFDAVYNPPDTRLLQQAKEAGAKTVGGIEMFVRQAAAQFEAWTALPAPRDLMREIVESRLSRR